eukprot:7662396-Karenia_brevis.AAC.1
MRELCAALDAAQPPASGDAPGNRLVEELSPDEGDHCVRTGSHAEGDATSVGSSVTNAWSTNGAVDGGADVLMQELADAPEDCGDEELAAIARRLKRARSQP